jgi:transposase
MLTVKMSVIMKYVTALSNPELITLKEAAAHHSNHRVRTRAHAIVLSSRHYSIPQLTNIFDSDRDTISHWIDLWETKGLTAIFDAKRSGRPPILTDEELQRLSELVQDEPRQLKKAHAQLTLETGKKFSLQCLISALKKTELHV